MRTNHNISFFDESKQAVIAENQIIPRFDGRNLYNIHPDSETIEFTNISEDGKYSWVGNIVTITHHMSCYPNVLVFSADNELIFPTVTVINDSTIVLDFDDFSLDDNVTYKCIVMYAAPWNADADIVDGLIKDKQFDIVTSAPEVSENSPSKLLYVGGTGNGFTKYHFYQKYSDGGDYSYVDIGEFDTGLGTHENNTSIHVTASEKALWNAKQDAIPNLSSIVLGASLGATALQSVPSSYRTASEQDTIDAGKQPLIDASHKLAYSLVSGTPSIPSAVSDLTNDAGYQTVADVTSAISLKADIEDLAQVAFTGSYNDLTDAPSIVNITSAVQDAGFVKSSALFEYKPVMVEQLVLTGTSVTIEPGKEYAWTLTGNSTINASGGVAGKVGECRIEITNNGTYTLSAGDGLTIKDAIQSNAKCYYTIRFSDTTARAYMFDVDEL